MNAKELLKNNIVIDAHLDLATHIELERSRGNSECIIEKFYHDEIENGGINFIVSAIGFASQEFLPELAVRKALRQISFMKQEIEMMTDRYMLCKSYSDMQQALAENKIGIILMLEGCSPLQNDISLLDVYYDLGVRIVSLVWSRRNFAGTGAAISAESRSNHHGLSDFGLQILERMEELGIIWDVSHLNDAGFEDGMEVYKKPMIATHAGCRALSNLLRNNSDEQILEIGRRGGMIGVNMVNIILDIKKKDKATVKDYVNHLEHIKDIAGIETVGFGFDFCNKVMPFVNERNLDALFPSGKCDTIDGYNYIYQVLEEMEAQGFSEQEVIKVIGGNFMDFFKKHL